jgi:hypothetical protein
MPNALMSAHRGADWPRAAINFTFFPAGFLEPILSLDFSS